MARRHGGRPEAGAEAVKPAILYAAKSTADIHASIPAQLKEGRESAEADGWTVVASFNDENKSAYTGNRGDELARAQQLAGELAAEHGECALFIQHSDRLARGDGIQAAHLVEYALWAIKSGVKIISKQDPQTFADLLYAVVTGQRNHEDSKRKSEGTTKGIREKAEGGGVTGGGRRRFGYRWAEDRSGMLLVVPHEAAVIDHRIYDGALAGSSTVLICRELTAAGVKTVAGGRWHPGTVSNILRNPLYKGIVVYKGEEYPGKHEAIVDPEKWDKVADLLNSRTGRRGGPGPRAKAQGAGGGRPTLGIHLFNKKGMLRCICGGTMVARAARRRSRSGGVEETYVCQNRHLDPSLCPVKPIRRDHVDPQVFRYFERVGVDIEATRAELASAQESRTAEVLTLREEARREAETARERRERVKRDYLEGRITAEDWSEFSGELSAELSAAEAQAARLDDQLSSIERAGSLADLEAEVLEKLAAIRATLAGEVSDARGVDAARAAMQRLFEGFALAEPHPGQQVPGELAWVSPSGYVLEPILQDGVVPTPEPLYTAANNFAVGVVTIHLFAPFAIENRAY
jgi:DNA invertase Pin-like site-specific DNA recombinase